MPKFLENALRHEGRRKGLSGKHLEHYVYGGMNSIGAMHGSKETPKGAAMEQKHEAKLKGMRIEIHKDDKGEITGHTVRHEFEPKSSKSGAFMERSPDASYPFGAGEHKQLAAHVMHHLGGKDDLSGEVEHEGAD